MGGGTVSRFGTAPVVVHDLAVLDNRIVGHAAPAGGPLPCGLRLEADGAIIAITRATGFSPDAAARGLRRGWCGVTLEGLDVAAALADSMQVYCVTSDRLLLETAVPAPSFVSDAPLTVEGLLDAMRREGCGITPASLLPFAQATLRRQGLHAMLDATYRTLLGRAADADVVAAWQADPPPEAAQAAIAMIAGSIEFRDRPGHMVPGPFHPQFAYDRGLIDD